MGGGENLTFKFSCNCKYRWYELNKRNLKTWELNPGTSGLIRNENMCTPCLHNFNVHVPVTQAVACMLHMFTQLCISHIC